MLLEKVLLSHLMRNPSSIITKKDHSHSSTNENENKKGGPISISKSSAVLMTMVFQFPHDFERKAYSTRRKEDLKETLTKIACLVWRILKVFTAFGQILSCGGGI